MQRIAQFNDDQFELRTDYSRSISLAILNENLHEISVKSDEKNPIEMFIPRDPKLFLSEMMLQNVTSLEENYFFHYHLINFNQLMKNKDISLSLHLQLRPRLTNLSYLFVYQFDQISLKNINGWKLFCPSSLSFSFFFQNIQ